MKISFYEIRYASTQFNLLSGADGFGVRTYTQGMPLELVDRLKARNLFFYESGSKPLCGSFELLQDPDLPATYPKTYACFRETVGDKTWLVLSRTAFIGRDYGWYLDPPEQNARSGNTFTHVVCFEDSDAALVAQAGLFRYFAMHFLPQATRNDSSNPELRRLLTNLESRPLALPLSSVDVSEEVPATDFLARPGLIETVLTVYHAFEKGQKVVCVLPAAQTDGFIATLLDCLPVFLRQQLDFVSNYHDFNLESRYKLLFVNEFYSRPIDERNPNLLLCNCLTRQFPSLPRSDFYDYLRQLLTQNDAIRLGTLLTGLGKILRGFEPGISLEPVFHAWHFLWSGEPPRFAFQPDVVMRQINTYPLQKAYLASANDYIMHNFSREVAQENHAKVANALKLVDELNWQGTKNERVESLLTTYFLAKNNATELLKQGVGEDLVFRNLDLSNYADQLPGFILQNEWMPRKVLDYFIVRFCIAFPEQTESLIYMALLGTNKPDHQLGELLLAEMPEPFEFVAKNDFFVFIGEEGQRLVFDQAIKKCLLEMYRENKPENYQEKRDPALQLRRALFRSSQALPYHHFLAEHILNAAAPRIHDLIYLLETYALCFEDKKPLLDTVRVMQNLLHMLLRCADQALPGDWDFLSGKIKHIEDCLAPARDDSQKLFLITVEATHRRAKFMRTVLENYNDPERLHAKIALPASDKSYFSYYLRFLLNVTAPTIWKEPDIARQFVRFLFHQENDADSWRDERYETDKNGGKGGLSDFIPYQVANLFRARTGDKAVADQQIEDFYCQYTFALWALHLKKQSTDESMAFFYYGRLLKIITNYLLFLRQSDRPLLQRVVTRICKTDPERDVDLKQHLTANFESDLAGDGFFSGFKKMFSSPSKKD